MFNHNLHFNENVKARNEFVSAQYGESTVTQPLSMAAGATLAGCALLEGQVQKVLRGRKGLIDKQQHRHMKNKTAPRNKRHSH